MKRCLCCILFILLMWSFEYASADIGSLVFKPTELVEETDDDESSSILLPVEEDPNGEIYPYTGLKSGERKYTVMLYLCGSDLEYSLKNPDGAATKDLKEIINSGYENSEMTVLVMAGGALKWRNEAVDVTDTAIYEVVDNTLVKRRSQGLISMSDEDTLTNFINYGYEAFPAEKYALIIWDHGGGPVGLLVSDKITSSSMTVNNVQEALSKSHAAEKRLSWLGFDACLMGSVEIAKEIMPYADYLIASAEVEPSSGWYYKFLNGMTDDASPVETGERIVSTYEEQYINKRPKSNLTLICMDLSKISDLETASNIFFWKVNEQLSKENYTKFASLRQDTLCFRQEDLDLIDLKDLMKGFHNLAENEAEKLSDAIDDLIVKSYTNIDNCSGLSTYFPYYDTKSYDVYRRDLYEQLDYSEAYHVFIDNFTKYEKGTTITNWSTLSSSDLQRDTRTIFTLQLSEEQATNLANYSFAIVRKTMNEQGDSCYVIVTDSEKPELHGTSLYADYVHKALYVVDDNENLLNDQPLRWTADQDENVQILAWLNSDEGSELVQLTCDLTEENELHILQILLWDEVGQYFSNRYSVDPEQYSTISFVVPGFMEKRDEEDVLFGISDWTQINDWTFTYDIHGNWTLKMMEDTIDQQELSAAFVLTDYQRRTHTNELMPVVPENASNDGLVLTYDDDYITIISGNVVQNQDDLYLLLTMQNPNQEEIFVHINQITLNEEVCDLETWIEGDGDFGGVPYGDIGTGTIVINLSLLSDSETLQRISFILEIVDAQSRESIQNVPVNGYIEYAGE